MKLKESIKKPLTTLFIFILGIFVVSGLSYITTVTGAAPGTSPADGNSFKPINTGYETQGRCVASNTSNSIRTFDSNKNLSYFYNDCQSSAILFTNGVFVKTPNTTFQITGDPSYSTALKYGALYVGCTSSTSILSPTVISKCGGYDKTPPAYFYGDIEMIGLIDQNQVEDKQLCLSQTGSTKGQVVICP